MRTEETISAIAHADKNLWHEILNRYRKAIDDIRDIYRNDVAAERTPQQTVSACIYTAGYELTLSIFASLINLKAWDERIYRNVAQWAAEQETAWDEKSACRIGMAVLADAIHPTHLNQLGLEMLRAKEPVSRKICNDFIAERVFLIDFVKGHTEELLAAKPDNIGTAVPQLRALWTAFVLHNTLDPKMSVYDGELQLLWGWITSDEHPDDPSRLYSDFAHFREDLSAALSC